MTIKDGQTFRVPSEDYILAIFPFKVSIPNTCDGSAVTKLYVDFGLSGGTTISWAIENFGWRAIFDFATGQFDDHGRWFSRDNDFYFKHERDAVEFKLRFG